MLKASELGNLSKEELIEKEGQLKKQLMQLRFDAKLGKLEKHSTIKEARRDVARVLTVLNQQSRSTNIAASPVKPKAQSKATVGSKTQSKKSVELKAQSKNQTSRSAS